MVPAVFNQFKVFLHVVLINTGMDSPVSQFKLVLPAQAALPDTTGTLFKAAVSLIPAVLHLVDLANTGLV